MENYIPLNFAILRHPLNWLIITGIVMLGGMAASLIFHPADDVTTEA